MVQKNFEGSRIYVIYFLVMNVKMLIQTGIMEVVYLSDKYAGTEGMKLLNIC